MKHRSPLRTPQIIALSNESVQKAARRVAWCEHCGKPASTPFSHVLESVLGHAKGTASYLITDGAICPKCKYPIGETTLVETSDRTGIEESLKQFKLSLPDTDIVLVDEDVLLEAQSLMIGCEACSTQAEIAFDYLLDEITGSDPTRIEYLLPYPARCPQCSSQVTEKTLVIS